MEFMDKKDAAKMVNSYMEREMSEFRKVTEKDLDKSVTPEAKAAFNRKPYYGSSSMNLKNRPVLR